MNQENETPKTAPLSSENAPARWLRYLFYLGIAGIVISCLSFLPLSEGWINWISKIPAAGMILCFFRLAPSAQRYRKAAVYLLICLCGTVLATLVPSLSILSLPASVCSLVGLYQEHSAHSDLTDPLDPKLSRKWHSLFNWRLFSGVLLAFSSMIAVLIAVFLQLDETVIATVIVGILTVPSIVLDVFYLLYLNRTIHLLENHEQGV